MNADAAHTTLTAALREAFREIGPDVNTAIGLVLATLLLLWLNRADPAGAVWVVAAFFARRALPGRPLGAASPCLVPPFTADPGGVPALGALLAGTIAARHPAGAKGAAGGAAVHLVDCLPSLASGLAQVQ